MADDDTVQLAGEGFELLQAGDYERVLDIANQLETRRYSACFELRGRALDALGRTEEAIETLRKGTEVASAASDNWHWLGTILSDAGRYQEALAAFDGEAEHGGRGSAVALNKAIVHSRRGDPASGLATLSDRPDDPAEAQAWHAHRANMLLALNRLDEAARDADAAIVLAAVPGVAAELANFARQIEARILARKGRVAEAKSMALQLVRDDSNDIGSCRLLRELRNLPLGGRRCLRLLVHGTPMDTVTPTASGAYTNYLVNATDAEEALDFVREIEGTLDAASLTVEEVEDVTDDPSRPDYPQAGVVVRLSGYTFYDEPEVSE